MPNTRTRPTPPLIHGPVHPLRHNRLQAHAEARGATKARQWPSARALSEAASHVRSRCSCSSSRACVAELADELILVEAVGELDEQAPRGPVDEFGGEQRMPLCRACAGVVRGSFITCISPMPCAPVTSTHGVCVVESPPSRSIASRKMCMRWPCSASNVAPSMPLTEVGGGTDPTGSAACV